MSYTAAVDHLYARGLELVSGPTTPRRKFDLDHMRILARALGNPQDRFPSVLIAGTNGKGSTAATLASILTAAGYRTGLYTSPHLSRVNERIRIDGQPISDDDFARLYFQVDTAATQLVTSGQLPQHPSFFETLTALAFLYFAGQPEAPQTEALQNRLSHQPEPPQNRLSHQPEPPQNRVPHLSEPSQDRVPHLRGEAAKVGSQDAAGDQSTPDQKGIVPHTTPTPDPKSVILSEARRAQSKDLRFFSQPEPPQNRLSHQPEPSGNRISHLSEPPQNRVPHLRGEAAKVGSQDASGDQPTPDRKGIVPHTTPTPARESVILSEALSERSESKGEVEGSAVRSPSPNSPLDTNTVPTPAPQAPPAVRAAPVRTAPVDIVILEVGLGGRLDATNIVEPLLSILTDISLDHQDYLGNTITEITREKAGILRPHGTLITLPQHPEANQAIGEAAADLDLHAINAAQYIPTADKLLHPDSHNVPAPQSQQPHPRHSERSEESLYSTPAAPVETSGQVKASGASLHAAPGALLRNRYTVTLAGEPLHVDSPLAGQHQQRNIALAIAAVEELRNSTGYKSKESNRNSYKITNAHIEQGIRNTQWPGRLELLPLPGSAPILLDVAHNPAGAWTLRAALAQLPEEMPRTLLFSCLRDKDLREMSQILLPLFDRSSPDRPHDHVVLAPIDSPRAASLEDLAAAARDLEVPAETTASLQEALAQARELTPSDGIIVATGSVYLIGALRTLILPSP